MAQQPTPPNPEPPHIDRCRQALLQLVDIGMAVANNIHRDTVAQAEATREPDAPPPADPTFALERVAKTVRRTVLLIQKLDEAPRRPSTAANRITARKRILRDVEDAIQRVEVGPRAEALHAELMDRLDAPDLEDDIALRPVVDIVQDMIRDLDLITLPGAHPWKRRTPADTAEIAERAAQPPRPDRTPLGPKVPIGAQWPEPRPPESRPGDITDLELEQLLLHLDRLKPPR